MQRTNDRPPILDYHFVFLFALLETFIVVSSSLFIVRLAMSQMAVRSLYCYIRSTAILELPGASVTPEPP
jgi:hypothetical protein